MTEEEARKTWCPEIKFVVLPGGNVLTSRGEIIPFKDAPHYSLCTSSDCQWWVEDEWSKTRIKDQDGHFINEPSGHCGAIK